MYRVLITGSIHKTGVEQLKQNPSLEVDFYPDLPLQEIIERIEPYHCLVTRSETPIQKELIDCATNLKVIARAAVGVANIDIVYATEKGILVINTPGKNTNSAAELTIALLLAAIRKITPAHQSMSNLQWNRHHFNGIELLGKTIGIIGLGNVGHRVAKFANAFDMKVLAYDPYITDKIFEKNKAIPSDFETLLSESDVITVHTPKNTETIHMIDAKAIAQMKDGVILLNAARGGIIEEKALLDGLQSGKVAYAGIDTWEVEPPIENRFRELPQVVMSPHIGASTTEAQIRIAESIAVQVPKALHGEVVDYPVNMPQFQVLEGNQTVGYAVLSEKLGCFASQFLTFVPTQLEIHLRGSLASQDGSLLKLSFLKGFLSFHHENVSYVNVEQISQRVGLEIKMMPDSSFVDYDSAVKFVFSAAEQTCKVGGVVFSDQHPRITFLDDFVFEIEPQGTLLVTSNLDRPGMIGVIGTVLGKHEVNIAQFELSRNLRGGKAMALIRVDGEVKEEPLQELSTHPYMTLAKKIVL